MKDFHYPNMDEIVAETAMPGDADIDMEISAMVFTCVLHLGHEILVTYINGTGRRRGCDETEELAEGHIRIVLSRHSPRDFDLYLNRLCFWWRNAVPVHLTVAAGKHAALTAPDGWLALPRLPVQSPPSPGAVGNGLYQ